MKNEGTLLKGLNRTAMKFYKKSWNEIDEHQKRIVRQWWREDRNFKK